MPRLEQRIAALECIVPASPVLLIINRLVAPGQLDELPIGIEAAPPYLPAVDRLPDEDWDTFVGRLEAMLAHLPAGKVVQVVSRHAPTGPARLQAGRTHLRAPLKGKAAGS